MNSDVQLQHPSHNNQPLSNNHYTLNFLLSRAIVTVIIMFLLQIIMWKIKLQIQDVVCSVSFVYGNGRLA